MPGPPNFDDIAARISKAIENSPAKDIEKNVKAMLSSGLARLDVVPRAEFDLQTEVLRKTRAIRAPRSASFARSVKPQTCPAISMAACESSKAS
jgi:BMFP domain-containing protein YqiC